MLCPSRASRRKRLPFHARQVAGFLGILGASGLILAVPCSAPQAQGRGADEVFSQEEICRNDYQTGLEYLKNRRLEAAAEAFSQVKEACPEMIDAYLNLGSIQVQLGQYLQAIDTYEDALDQDPANFDIKEGMAYALSSAGELDEAITLYLELHAQRPEQLDLMRNLAFVYKQQDYVAEAIMLYNRLIELGAADAVMVSEAGRLALEQKLFLPAVTFYKKLYESNPEDVNTLSILGGYYYKIRFYGQAIPYYEKILELQPEHTQALLYHKILGACHKSEKNYAQAAESFEHVLSREPNEVGNYCNLAFIYKDLRDHAKAISTVHRGLEVDQNAGCLYYAWGVALEVRGREEEGGKDFDGAIADYQEAKVKFQKVIDLRDPVYNRYAPPQLERMDALIDRARRLIEREEMGR